jgi:hypothetical protein
MHLNLTFWILLTVYVVSTQLCYWGFKSIFKDGKVKEECESLPLVNASPIGIDKYGLIISLLPIVNTILALHSLYCKVCVWPYIIRNKILAIRIKIFEYFILKKENKIVKYFMKRKVKRIAKKLINEIASDVNFLRYFKENEIKEPTVTMHDEKSSELSNIHTKNENNS